ncbi:enoyl-CoA hydratase/isomerase family protein [Pseudogulbenkiania subflava]|uniref:3-hydroxyisobutyryl-CoA hydrolase n=1 Tax=Pseudogulbenkiania subflava DSM 22618 TaxID=1123014 RepID=A0A1Y6BG82_9NEIS|nr:enoyl-CoA hydratase/isomerase family protein [Pseudogulbenkiania subflava]SMF06256.1 Enoyl-CoA hydratase/carnithine racemase [Pseudogulbenkiania subflava DSM 22618]
MNDEVLFEELTSSNGRRIGVATLNAEKSLNALTLGMIRLLDAQLQRWAADDAIACVLLRGAGERAFCAGGDVRAVRDAILVHRGDGPIPEVVTFFREEYTLDHRLHTYPKPVIVWGHGIVMGGGLGLMVGASHRVATPATRIAMPEITIGLYPDVAGSWFLQRMPAKLGLFLGLTGAPLNAHDALIVNLADHVVALDGYSELLARLTDTAWSDTASANHAAVTARLNDMECATHASLPMSNVERQLVAIHRLMNRGSLAAVAQALTDGHFDDPWLQAAAHSFAHGSPSSAAVTWEIYRRAKHLSLAEALRMELILSVNFCSKPDFREGVRALLVDKDRQPQWSRKTLAEVDQAWVDSHFTAPWSDGEHPLAALG